MPAFNLTNITDRTIMQNEVTAFDYFLRLCEMSLATFKWNNLPDTCDVRYLELSLLTCGQAIFFRDDVTGDYLNMRFVVESLDIYGNPDKRTAYSYDGKYTKSLDKTNSVAIYNNKLRNPFTLNLVAFAKRLENIDRTIDVNVLAQKTPVLLVGDQKQMLALRNVYRKYVGNEPVLFADKQINSVEIKSIRTDAPYMADRLWSLKMDIWNEALTYLGVPNISINKKERMVTDEVNRTQGGVLLNRDVRLSERQKACEDINRMFGLNVSCEFNNDYGEVGEDGDVEEVEKEVIDNG